MTGMPRVAAPCAWAGVTAEGPEPTNATAKAVTLANRRTPKRTGSRPAGLARLVLIGVRYSVMPIEALPRKFRRNTRRIKVNLGDADEPGQRKRRSRTSHESRH